MKFKTMFPNGNIGKKRVHWQVERNLLPISNCRLNENSPSSGGKTRLHVLL